MCACITGFPIVIFAYCLISCSYVLIFTTHLSCTCVPDMHAINPISCTRWVVSDNSGPVCSDVGVWSVADPSVTIRVAQGKLERHRSSSSQLFS